MLAAGVEMVVISKRLGHSSMTITSDTYAHLWKESGGTPQSAPERSSPGSSVITT